MAWYLSQLPQLGINGIWIAYPVAFTCALLGQTTYYFCVWKKRPLRPLLGAPVA